MCMYMCVCICVYVHVCMYVCMCVVICLLLQMVRCGLSRQLPRIETWTQHGFAVVMLDNRGSANRGVAFESYIKVRENYNRAEG